MHVQPSLALHPDDLQAVTSAVAGARGSASAHSASPADSTGSAGSPTIAARGIRPLSDFEKGLVKRYEHVCEGIDKMVAAEVPDPPVLNEVIDRMIELHNELCPPSTETDSAKKQSSKSEMSREPFRMFAMIAMLSTTGMDRSIPIFSMLMSLMASAEGPYSRAKEPFSPSTNCLDLLYVMLRWYMSQHRNSGEVFHGHLEKLDHLAHRLAGRKKGNSKNTRLMQCVLMYKTQGVNLELIAHNRVREMREERMQQRLHGAPSSRHSNL